MRLLLLGKNMWCPVQEMLGIGNCAGKDTFFRLNTKHGLGLEAWSVFLLPPAPITREKTGSDKGAFEN